MATTVQDTGMSTAVLDAMNPKKSAAGKSTVEETQDRFMKLLVTQMRNQDPMNPLDNAQVTSQFAQLSTVTGIDKLNDTLASMMSNYQSGQALQAANMIGHGVLVPGSRIEVVKGAGLMGIELKDPADKVTVTIRDSAGLEIRKLELGEQKAGTTPIAWDGKSENGTPVADGNYSFQITATRNDAPVTATALQFGVVDSVSTNAQGVKLNVGDLVGVNLADVRQIL
ncbi:flagellar hook assembly protein FlgD [Herbaspirillum sp. GCM10030257]|uniref:flagellar hook assembly protein FlgD n=1 Tax=Herbaspirillum sp. GCM10030257 TaxID=3273393 RepID=UPI003615EBDF